MKRNTKAIKDACAVVGSQAEMARLLGVSAPTVNEWVTGQRPVPVARCIVIERLTQQKGKRIPVERFNPRLNWDLLRLLHAEAQPEPAERVEG